MKRSRLNRAFQEASQCFAAHGWALPPNPRWDITDLGLGDFDKFGLVLINLAEEPEYCEKLMYARQRQVTAAHTHARKKEDIICRWGRLALRLWPRHPAQTEPEEKFKVRICGLAQPVTAGAEVVLEAGQRITLSPGVFHEFYPLSPECIIGEVSTANDDRHDNFFVNPEIGRFPGIEEDEPPLVRLISEKS